jgi:predicted transcriptional regulator
MIVDDILCETNLGAAKVDDTDNHGHLVALTVDIICSYVTKNSVQRDQLSDLIDNVYNTLAGLSRNDPSKASALQPAVPIKKSVTRDFIICLEDGKKFKSLKRHLLSTYGMTPEDYRARWNLPSDYPMVAPSYSEHRSDLANRMGLGRKPAQ